MSRLILLVAAPITLYLVAAVRPVAEQGFYFVFANVQAIAALFEFGVGTMAVQITAHEASLLECKRARGLVGPPHAVIPFLVALAELQRWFLAAAAILAVILLPGGWWFFRDEAVRTGVGFLWPWFGLVVATAIYLRIVPLLCALEGLGELREVQGMRVRQALISVAIGWLAIPSVGGPMAVMLAAMAQVVTAAVWLGRHYSSFVRDALRFKLDSAGHTPLRKLVVRAQTHSGAFWVTAFVGAQALTPIVFHFQGSDLAGRVGLSVALTSAPLTLAVSWLQSRYPEYGKLVANGQTQRLVTVATRATVGAAAACIAGEVAVLAGAIALRLYLPAVGTRLLPLLALAALAATNVAFLFYQALAGYLRAYREEPLLPATAIGTASVVIATALGARAGHLAAVYMFFAAVALIWFPVSAGVFVFRRRAVEHYR